METNTAINQQLISIDNLADGNCGYISFIIGALYLAKNGQAPHFLNRWKELDSGISVALEKALKLEFEELSHNSEFITPLVDSLRKILCQFYLQSLPSAQEKRNYQYFSLPDKNMILEQFFQLCRHAIHKKTKNSDMTGEFVDMNHNDLWHFSEMQQIATKVAEIALQHEVQIENEQILNTYLFAALIYHRDAVQRSYQSWSKNKIWMTDRQAFQLSEIFNIPVVISTDCQRPEGGFIHLNNKDNYHWTVFLYDAKYPYRFKVPTIEEKFRDLVNTYFSEKMREIFGEESNQEEMLVRIPNICNYLTQYKQKFSELVNCLEDPQQFIINIENECFFSLFKNCIDVQIYENEFKIASLKLLMYLDKENTANCQSTLNQALDKRYAMTEEVQLSVLQYFNYFREQVMDLSDSDDSSNSTDSMLDLELVEEFLAETECYSYIGFWIGAVLSTIAAIALIVSSFDLIGPAMICIVLGTITGYLLGICFDKLFEAVPPLEINRGFTI